MSIFAAKFQNSSENMAEVNLRIKEICREQGITLETLASRLGIIRPSLAQAMSRNSFSTKKLGEIADALNVPVWQLFASPDSVTERDKSQSLVCPHCGKPIALKVEQR